MNNANDLTIGDDIKLDGTVLDARSLEQLAERRLRAKPCCMRITRDGMVGWCRLPDEHSGECGGVMSAPIGKPMLDAGRKR